MTDAWQGPQNKLLHLCCSQHECLLPISIWIFWSKFAQIGWNSPITHELQHFYYESNMSEACKEFTWPVSNGETNIEIQGSIRNPPTSSSSLPQCTVLSQTSFQLIWHQNHNHHFLTASNEHCTWIPKWNYWQLKSGNGDWRCGSKAEHALCKYLPWSVKPWVQIPLPPKRKGERGERKRKRKKERS